MHFLQNLRLRSEGCESDVDYDTILSRFQCTSHLCPPPDILNSRLLSCAFAKKRNHGHILAVTCEEGQIIILNTENTRNNTPYRFNITETVDNGNALFSVAWSEIDMKLVTTSGDHAVDLWDAHNGGALTKVHSFRAHRCSVKTACFKPQDCEIFASGGRDGNIYVWDSRSFNREPEQYINNCHKNRKSNKNENSSITCLVFQDDNKLISCADTDTSINVWDLRKTYLRNMEKPVPLYQLPSPKKNSLQGYSHMVINRNGTKLFANSFSHNIFCYNVSSYSKTLESVYSGHSVRNFFAKLCLSPDERYITSTDSDNKIYFWKVNSSGKPVVMLGGKSDLLNGLSDISWCAEDPLKLATSSDHASPWIWTVPPENTASQSQFCDANSGLGPISYVERLSTVPVKCRRNSAMISKTLKNSMKLNKELPSIIMLPNTVSDGFQIHTCVSIEKKSNIPGNWLTNLHNQQNQQIKKLVVEKVIKTPSPLAKKSKKIKRKRCSMSPGNNLTKYFKRTDENLLA